MTDICKNAKCSNVYIAHCLRGTSIQVMNDSGHELRHIMFMTGQHKKSLSSMLSCIAMRVNMSSNDQPQNKENAVDPPNICAFAFKHSCFAFFVFTAR